MLTRHTLGSALGALVIATSVTAISVTPANAEKVSMAIVNAVSDVGLFIADAKGYFKDEGIEPDFVTFDTGAKLVYPPFVNEPLSTTGRHEANDGRKRGHERPRCGQRRPFRARYAHARRTAVGDAQ